MLAIGPYGQSADTITPLEGGPEYEAFIQKVQHFYTKRGQVPETEVTLLQQSSS